VVSITSVFAAIVLTFETADIQFPEGISNILDLTIENNDVPVACRMHQLVSLEGKMEDRKTSATKCDTSLSIDPCSAVIRFSMVKSSGQRLYGSIQIHQVKWHAWNL
jgi:hypothetical protein